MRTIVVGGGIAGLACAWRLRERGHDVVVLEREAQAGGRMRSERHGDFVLDRGAQFIASAYTNLHAVTQAVGLASEVRTMQRTRDAILRNGVLHGLDHGAPLSLLRTRLLSPGAKLRLSRILFEQWRHRHHIDPRHPEHAATIDREDMPTYLRRIVGDEAFEYVFAPSFSSTFDSDPEDLSGAFVLLASRLMLSGFALQSFVGGTGRLTAALADLVKARTGCHVTSVTDDGKQVRVAYEDSTGVETIEGDAAVVAVPGSQVRALCPNLTAEESAFFADVRYVRGMIVFLLFDTAPATLPYYGVAFPRREGIGVYGLAVDHHKPGVAPSGAGLINVALTATAAHHLRHADDDAVVAHVLTELGRTPIGRLAPRAAVVHRWDPMLPQFYAGYTRKLADFLTRQQRSPRIAFAGDYLVGPFTEAALTSGLRAADEITDLPR